MRKTLATPQHRALCTLLREQRERQGLTQASVAKKLGKPQPFVARYESGERRLDVIEFLHVSRAIGIDPIKLLKQVRI